MSHPPKSTPHSDIEGVHRDEKPNVESAIEAGEGAEDLARAHAENAARPEHSEFPGESLCDLILGRCRRDAQDLIVVRP